MPKKPLLLWLALGAIAAGVVAWIAAQVHLSGHAPVGLVSVAVGALLGIALAWLAGIAGIYCKWRLVVGTLLLAACTVVAEHAWLYRDFRRQWQEAREKSTTVAMLRSETPPGPDVYFTHEWNPGLWISDAAIIIVVGVGTVVFLRRGGNEPGLVAEAKSVDP
ncbi:MAG TPA: hypothetical protein VH107_03090 [Lacipirellulaceae bacterium]|nr:hypothetical protein [Lacipirellulaceae bacterium]